MAPLSETKYVKIDCSLDFDVFIVYYNNQKFNVRKKIQYSIYRYS